MAAPTFVGAGAGVTIASGSAAVTAAGSGVQVGDLVILQVLQDGTAASAVTYSAISGIANLAGTASSLTVLATDQQVGNPSAARQHLRVGRATSTTCSVTVATTGDDLYYRIYVFRGVNTGTALTDILENATAGTVTNGFGTGTSVTDTGVTTIDVDRLALQFVGINDDSAIDAFAGMAGGTWVEAIAEYATATGTDACIQLQTGATTSLAVDNLAAGASSWLIHGAPGSSAKQAQSFLSPGGSLVTVEVGLRRTGSPTDNVVVEICPDDGTGAPSATVLATASMAASPIPTVTTNYSFALPAALSAATYWIVISRTGARDTVNYTNWMSSSADYADGVRKSYTSTVPEWSIAAADAAIRVRMASAGTIDGGSDTIVTAGWGVLGFALKPLPTGTAHTVPINDTLAVTDSLTSAKGKTVQIPDTLALADAFARATATQRTVADTFTLTDARTFARAKAFADSLTLADLLVAGRSQAVPLTDVLALADAVNIDWTAVRDQNELVGLTDSFTRIHVALRTVADAVTLADLASPVKTAGGVTHTVPLADVLALSDVFARVMAYGRTHADGLVLVDSTRDAQGIRLGDVVVLVDQLARIATRVRAFADAVALTDSTTRSAGKSKALADAVALTDQLARAVAKARTLTDAVVLADQFSRAMTKARTVADTVALADARRIAQGQALADTLALVDQLTRIAPRIRTFADAVLLSDAVLTSKTGAGALNPADLVLIADSFTRLATYTRTIADQVTLADARSLGRGKRVTDQIALADLLARTVVRVRTIADAIAITDAVAIGFAGAHTRLLTDLIAIADALTRAATWQRAFADTVALTDLALPQTVAARTASIADLVALADSLQRVMATNRAFADVVALFDSIGIEGGVRSGRILNDADDIRWGETQADRVLVGTEEVWVPA